MYRIGRFSKLVNVSTRMLRYYDEHGIFSPSHVDPDTGYRMYSPHQIPDLNQIILLRDSGFKVEEITDALTRINDAEFLESLLKKKMEQSLTAIENEQQKIKQIKEQLKLLKEEQQMIKGTEIDFVVKNSLKALELYKEIFEIEVVEATNYPEGSNEAVFTLYNTRFHMLDANPDYGLKAPDKEHPNTIWFNISVEDIEKTYQTALENGCTEIQPITEMMDGAVRNALFVDPYGYMWMLHQIYENLSFEERIAILEEDMHTS
ncbi:MerR family transcriptional regulator [Enterococcus sp. BWM-S5]|uniref:MerR family transcriptional regulator n=2 Tax=Enterococcus larvae TaxID=2794352 RepID=A0ABS4CHV3_9ENTE|nr:MerR family transcriptional regulator [Enterococcus larvae]